MSRNSQEEDDPLNKVNPKVEKAGEIICDRCDGHLYPESCHFKHAKYYGCGTLGYLFRVCQARKKNKQAPPSTNKKSDTPQTTHQREKRTPRGEKRDLGTYS